MAVSGWIIPNYPFIIIIKQEEPQQPIVEIPKLPVTGM